MSSHTHCFDHACDEYKALSRRDFVKRSTATAVALSVPAWLPRVTYAQAENSDRDVLVSIFLRGGADGLTLVPPFGDASYYALRPTIAIPRPDSGSATPAINLDGFFGLPTAMAALIAGLSIRPAADRACDGLDRPDALALRRAVLHGDRQARRSQHRDRLVGPSPREQAADARRRGIARTRVCVRSSAGARRRSRHAADPDPANFGLAGNSATRTQRLNWLGKAYQPERDPLRTAALNTQRTISTLSALNIAGYVPAGGAVYPGGGFGTAMRSTAALIRSDIGLEAVQIDIGGWDTHSAQGPLTGGMAQLMQQFAGALAAFHTDMNAAGRMGRVTLVAMSEFGRVARENASQGTDHGHGNAMFVMGGAVAGGRVLRNWPGLAAEQLYEDRTSR